MNMNLLADLFKMDVTQFNHDTYRSWLNDKSKFIILSNIFYKDRCGTRMYYNTYDHPDDFDINKFFDICELSNSGTIVGYNADETIFCIQDENKVHFLMGLQKSHVENINKKINIYGYPNAILDDQLHMISESIIKHGKKKYNNYMSDIKYKIIISSIMITSIAYFISKYVV